MLYGGFKLADMQLRKEHMGYKIWSLVMFYVRIELLKSKM